MKKKFLAKNLILASILLTAGCSKHEEIANQEPLKFQTKQIVTKNIPVTIDSFGNLVAHKNVDIKAQVSGQIKKIFFKEGSCVKVGDLLILIDDETYKANLKIDEAALLQDVEDYKYQRYVLEKDQKLYQSGSMPKQTYEKMLSDLAQVKARIESDKARVELDKLNLEHCSITSPINGVVGYIKVDEGSIITSSGDVIANVKEIDPLYVDFSVPGDDLPRIKNALNEKGEVKIIVRVNSKENDNSDSDIQYDGVLKFLNNEIQDTSGTIQLRGIIPNPKMKLLPGLFANVELVVGELKNAILVPEEAFLTDNEKHYFFVVSEDGKARKVFAEVLGTHEGYCIVAKSKEIRPSTQVITTGLLNVEKQDVASL